MNIIRFDENSKLQQWLDTKIYNQYINTCIIWFGLTLHSQYFNVLFICIQFYEFTFKSFQNASVHVYNFKIFLSDGALSNTLARPFEPRTGNRTRHISLVFSRFCEEIKFSYSWFERFYSISNKQN